MNKVNLVVVVADVVVESEVAEDADPAAELHVIRDDRVVHLAPDAVQKYVDPALNKYQLGLQNRRERKLLQRGLNSPVDYAVLATTSKALIIRSIPGLDPQ